MLTSASSTPLGVNWTPIIQGLVSGVAQSLGSSVSFPTPLAKSPVEVQGTPSIMPSPVTQTPASVDLSPVISRLVFLDRCNSF